MCLDTIELIAIPLTPLSPHSEGKLLLTTKHMKNSAERQASNEYGIRMCNVT